MKTIWMVVFCLIGLPLCNAVQEDEREPLTPKDIERTEKEIKDFGLETAPRIDHPDAARALAESTAQVVVLGGGRETLENLQHLEQLDSLYLLIGDIEEKDLELLAGFENLKRLSLGMPTKYRLKQELWIPISNVSSLEQLDVNCDP